MVRLVGKKLYKVVTDCSTNIFNYYTTNFGEDGANERAEAKHYNKKTQARSQICLERALNLIQ